MPRVIDAVTIQTEMLQFYFSRPDCTISSISEGQNGAPHKINRRTLNDWVQHYLSWDQPPAITRAWLGKRKSKTNPGTLFSMEQKQELRGRVLQNPVLYLDEIQDRLSGWGLPRVSIATIQRYLKQMGLSHRVLLRVARQQCDFERGQYRARIERYDPSDLVFVDETAKDRTSRGRQRGYAMRGSDARILEYFLETPLVYTLIAAADQNGFIPEACLQIDREVTTNTSEIFEMYLANYLLPIMNPWLSGRGRSVLVLDNARVHNPTNIQTMCEAAGVHVVWTARYSPDLNPIEYFFRSYKSCLKRLGFYLGESFVHNVALATSVSERIAHNVFVHCGLIPSDDDDEISLPIVKALIESGNLKSR